MDGVAETPEKMDRYVRTIFNKTNEMDHLINELINSLFSLSMAIFSSADSFSLRRIIQIRVKDVGDFVQVEIEEMARELHPKICRIFLTVSTGRMFHVIHPREEAESVFPL